jgi:hypothetical protein
MDQKTVLVVNGDKYEVDLSKARKVENFLASTEVGAYVIVRTYSAGVFAGTLAKREGREVLLNNARRIWYWDGAASLSQLAQDGTSKPDKCQFPCPVDEVVLTEAIEILAVTAKAKASIEGVPKWEK